MLDMALHQARMMQQQQTLAVQQEAHQTMLIGRLMNLHFRTMVTLLQ